jgi:hypothetical protein
MTLKLNITPEDIDALVKDSIMKSGFGNAVAESVKRALNVGNYNSPIDKEVSSYVSGVVRELLHTEYGSQIREQVSIALKEQMTQEFMEKIASKVASTIRLSDY